MSWMRMLVLGGLMVGGGGLRAQSFDCAKAATDVEKAVCADKSLGAADVQLAAAYKALLAAAPVEMKSDVRGAEGAWLRKTARACHEEGAKKGQGELVACLKRFYEERTEVLKKSVMEKAGVTFLTREVTLLKKDGPDEAGVSGTEDNPGYGTLNATWPQASSGDPEWVAWNAAVLAMTQKVAGQEKVGGAWDKDLAEGTDTDVTATLGIVTKTLVTVGLANEGMGHGAAHPSESYAEFNWLLQARRELKAGDVFRAGSGWEAFLMGRCSAGLRKQFGEEYKDYAGADYNKTLRRIVVAPESWQIDAQGITVAFPEYSVAARVDQAEPVLVPWSALKVYLVAGFEVPQ